MARRGEPWVDKKNVAPALYGPVLIQLPARRGPPSLPLQWRSGISGRSPLLWHQRSKGRPEGRPLWWFTTVDGQNNRSVRNLPPSRPL